MTAKELATQLNDCLPDALFQRLTEFIDQGNLDDLYNEMADLDMSRHPEDYTSMTYEVEYDSDYTGGSYSGVGKFVFVKAASERHIPQLFKNQTGIDPMHIVHAEIADLADA